jgi:hypothetical protein
MLKLANVETNIAFVKEDAAAETMTPKEFELVALTALEFGLGPSHPRLECFRICKKTTSQRGLSGSRLKHPVDFSREPGMMGDG